ncbi:MAG: discoidin domain-containing protein, partial [Armatimonadetes bacterium]|nr:discoidin domain-containing protein [Armatimonadota bacterium]
MTGLLRGPKELGPARAVCGLAALIPLVSLAQGEADPRPEPNLALGCAVTFDTPPNNASATDPDDARQLVDGRLSPETPMWYDKSAVGWLFTDPTVFTLDLGSIRPIRGVGLHVGAGQAGVEWPASFHLYVSDDGDRFSHVGDLMRMLTASPPEEGYAALWLVADRLETHGRYVRFVGSPVNRGNGAYIMLDEAEVYEGDAAWLDRPLVY